ncbi:hypothetical protein ACLOJK_010072 [Asimina triloba]
MTKAASRRFRSASIERSRLSKESTVKICPRRLPRRQDSKEFEAPRAPSIVQPQVPPHESEKPKHNTPWYGLDDARADPSAPRSSFLDLRKRWSAQQERSFESNLMISASPVKCQLYTHAIRRCRLVQADAYRPSNSPRMPLPDCP